MSEVDFYRMLWIRALDHGNDEVIAEYEYKYARALRKIENKLLPRALKSMVILTILAPILIYGVHLLRGVRYGV